MFTFHGFQGPVDTLYYYEGKETYHNFLYTDIVNVEVASLWVNAYYKRNVCKDYVSNDCDTWTI